MGHLLAAAAGAGGRDEEDRRRAFREGALALRGAVKPDLWPPPADLGMDELARAMAILAGAGFRTRRRALAAVALVLKYDRRIEPAEYFLFRALGAALDCRWPQSSLWTPEII